MKSVSERSNPFAETIKMSSALGSSQQPEQAADFSLIPSSNSLLPMDGADETDEVSLTTALQPQVMNRSSEAGSVVIAEEEVNDQHQCLRPRNLPQSILSTALRRIGLSGSGRKAVLADRLEQAGFTDSKTIMDLAHQWEKHHAVDASLEIDETRAGLSRGRAPNWSRHETARLCHVIADARLLTTVTRMNQRVETKEELDQGRHDPFAHEFLELFNSTDFTPSVPESVDGITEDVLVTFEPSLHPHIRNGTTLKQRWAKLRSSYTIASSNYNASGQSDPSTCPSLTNGDDSLCYMHCVFQRHPSLDAVIRALPETAQIEAVIGDNEDSRQSCPPGQRTSARKRRRDEGLSSVARAISKMAESSTSPQPIVIQDRSAATACDPEMMQLERATNFVVFKTESTVTQLMELESQILVRIDALSSSVLDETSNSKKCVLESRLRKPRKMIENAISSIVADDSVSS